MNMVPPPLSGDLYQMTGPPGPHRTVGVPVGQRDEAGTVKARLAEVLDGQCGQGHWVSARRVNRKGTVLHWRVTAYCWPEGYAPLTRGQMAAECDGIDGMLRPADQQATEEAHEARLGWAADMAGDVVLRSRGLVS